MGCSQSTAADVVQSAPSAKTSAESTSKSSSDVVAPPRVLAATEDDPNPDQYASLRDHPEENDSMLSMPLSSQEDCESVPEFVEYPGAIASYSSDSSTKLPSTFTFSFIQVGDDTWSQSSASSISPMVPPMSEHAPVSMRVPVFSSNAGLPPSSRRPPPSVSSMRPPPSMSNAPVSMNMSVPMPVPEPVPVPVATQVLGDASSQDKVGGEEEPTVVVEAEAEAESVQMVPAVDLEETKQVVSDETERAVAVSVLDPDVESTNVLEPKSIGAVVEVLDEESKQETEPEVAAAVEALVETATTVVEETELSAVEEHAVQIEAPVDHDNEPTDAEPELEAETSASATPDEVFTITGHSTTAEGIVVYQLAKTDTRPGSSAAETDVPTISRRFSDFRRMYKDLKASKLPDIKAMPSLPSGVALRSRRSEKLISNRSDKLEAVLQFISEHPALASSAVFQAFVNGDDYNQDASTSHAEDEQVEVSAKDEATADPDPVAVA